MKCRHCASTLELPLLDLGFAPPSNAYLSSDDLFRPEKYYPLRVKVCERCWLAQTEDYAEVDELFRPDYAYFSSISSTWLDHARSYCEQITERLELTETSLVVEVASNDGYLLRNFVAAGIPCLGIEPTASTASAARALGITVLQEFFGDALASRLVARGSKADLIIGNNVYAHVPDINDFTRGLASLLKPEGVVTLEFPHLLRLLEKIQFDTVYHEHFSYLSLHATQRIFREAGLRVWDVEELPTHGGSLRIYGCLASSAHPSSPRVSRLLAHEEGAGLTSPDIYRAFQAQADRIKDELLCFLIDQKRAGRRVAAYGAAAKGNTLLNYAGVRADLLPYVCDAAPAKQGKFLPGSHIPILAPDALERLKPEFVVILPWNVAGEVARQLSSLAKRGTRFVTAVPKLELM